MQRIPRRTVLEQLGVSAAVVAGLGVGRGAAVEDDEIYDALEEINEALADLHEEVSGAEAEIDSLADDIDGVGGGDSDFDEVFDENFGQDSDEEFDDNFGQEFDDGFDDQFSEEFDTGFDDDFDDGPDQDFSDGFDSDLDGGGDSSTTSSLEDLDDDIVINGVPIGEKETLEELNETEQERLGDDLLVNNVPVSAESSDRPNENGSSSTDSTSASIGPETRGPTVESDVSRAEESSTEADSEGNGNGFSGDALVIAENILADVSEEHAEATDQLDEARNLEREVVEREATAAEALLDSVEAIVETAGQSLDRNVVTAVEGLRVAADRIDEHTDRLEDVMDEFEPDDVF